MACPQGSCPAVICHNIRPVSWGVFSLGAADGVKTTMTLKNRWIARLLAGLGLLGTAFVADAATPDRLVHRFLEVALSPDGRAVASVEGDAPPSGSYPVIRDLHLRSGDGTADRTIPLPCGRVEDCWPSALAWAPDGKTLAFALRTPGTHARSIYRMAPGDAAPVKLLGFDGTVGDLEFGADGALFMLATAGADKEVGATEAGAPITGDAKPPPEQRIARLDGDHLTFLSPPDLYVYQYALVPGGGFVGTAAPGDGDANWWTAKLYAFGDGAERILFAPPDNRHQIASPHVSPDGASVAFVSGLMSDFGSFGGDVYRVPIQGGAATNLTPGLRGSASSASWDCGGGLIVRMLAGGDTRLVHMAADGGEPKTLWAGQESLSGSEARPLSMSCAAGSSAIAHESFTAPPELEVGPVGRWRDVTRANAGLTMPLTVRNLTWKSDDFEVQGWLLSPTTGSGKRPLIVQVHGGPGAASTPYFFGPGVNTALLARGYALFRPNPRGSFGQGEAFASANVRDLGHGDLRDILAGVDAAERVAPIDDARLAITGGSFGGFMTMWAVTQTQRFKAGVAVAGISNWQSYYGENGIDQWLLPYFGASVYDDPKVYGRSSPIEFIRNVKTPVLIYVGGNDIECPPPQSQEYWHALHELGVPTSLMIYPGEGHGLRDPANLADAERRTLDWFDRYLK